MPDREIQYHDTWAEAREKINAIIEQAEDSIPSIWENWHWYLWETDTWISATWPQWEVWPQWEKWEQWERWERWEKWDQWEKGEKWDKGEQGPRGYTWAVWPKWAKWDKWDPFTYDDFTPEQLEWLKWPKWDTWEKGEKWDTWAKWDKWEKWDRWFTWATWPKWDKWDTGPQWEKGIQWEKWEKGDTWATWPAWEKWEKWDKWDTWATGATGPQWPKWDTWETWPQWPQGEQGPQWETWPAWSYTPWNWIDITNDEISVDESEIDVKDLADSTNKLAVVSATAPSNPTQWQMWYDTTTDILKTYDWTNWNVTSNFPWMTILSYWHSTWQDFLDAYNNNAIVYCRASSNSNPATWSQTRMAFMAYVNNAESPTEVEFQYYRSVSTKSATNQWDQVYVYKLTKTTWRTVETRNTYTKIVAGTWLTTSYSGWVLTISLA